MLKFAPACAAALLLLTASTGAGAGENSRQTGATQTVGYGHCAKGPCMKRTSFKKSVPLQHLGKGDCKKLGPSGYALGRRPPC